MKWIWAEKRAGEWKSKSNHKVSGQEPAAKGTPLIGRKAKIMLEVPGYPDSRHTVCGRTFAPRFAGIKARIHECKPNNTLCVKQDGKDTP